MVKYIKSSISKCTGIRSSICTECWPDGYDEKYGILTFRGPWLHHEEKMCDSRKVLLEHPDDNNHCVCDRHRDFQREGGEEQGTLTYDGVKHDVSEFECFMKRDLNWESESVEAVKQNPDIDPKLHFQWVTVLFVGGVTRMQFNLTPSPIQYFIAILSLTEMASNYQEWEISRRLFLDEWDKVVKILPADLSALMMRNVMEYICGRSLYRVTQSPSFAEFPYHIDHVKDPMLKQLLGGNWSGLCYICMEVMNSKRPLELKYAGIADLTASTFNNWGSFHRDLRDGTINNTVHYYRDTGYSMSTDLYHLIELGLYRSGASARSVLSFMDLNDMNSRNKFTENYYHCQVEGFSPLSIKPDDHQIVDRLATYYGDCPTTQLSSYDIYCYILTIDLHPNSPQYANQKDPSLTSLHSALSDCLSPTEADTHFPLILTQIQFALTLQLQSYTASLQKDHTAVTKLGQQYRLLRMTQWSMELNGKLPIGTNLIVVYHVMHWFMKNMNNVDEGCQKLADIKYDF